MEDLFQPAITAAIVSAAVSVGLLLLQEYKIEPKRWLKNTKVGHLQKQLEVHGALVTLLDSCRVKAMRQRKEGPSNPNRDYLLELPLDADKFENIFEKSNYLLSNELRREWVKLVRQDEYFAIFNSRSKGPSSQYAHLKSMHDIAKKDFEIIKQEYRLLTGIDVPKDTIELDSLRDASSSRQ